MAVLQGIVSMVAVGIYVICTTLIAASYGTSFVFDRPVHSAVLCCLLAGTSLLLLSKFYPGIFDLDASTNNYGSIPLTESTEPSSRTADIESTKEGDTAVIKGIRAWTSLVPFVVGCILMCIRVELFRQNTLHDACARTGYSYAIPFFISLYGYVRYQREKTPKREAQSGIRRAAHYILTGNLRYVIPASMLIMGGFLVNSLHEGRRSTYICPIVLHEARRMQVLKIISVLVDSALLLCAAESLRMKKSSGRSKSVLTYWGFALLSVVLFWVIVGVVIFYLQPEHREYLCSATPRYYRSAFMNAALVTLLCIGGLRLIVRYGIVGLSISTTFCIVLLSLIGLMWAGQHPFPHISILQSIVALLVIFIGAAVFVSANAMSEEEPLLSSSARSRSMRILFAVCVAGLTMALCQKNRPKLLPIDLLVYNGKLEHEKYVRQAKVSRTFKDAVWEYKRRYNQHPPPGFDQWYDFAISRQSLIIDDFDQIHSDLLPFRALPPDHLRKMTREIASDPFNDVGAIMIRNGSARLQEDIKPTHAWMVSGAMEMMTAFVEHLPDMDLIFNLNDEPRVAVPWETMSEMKEVGTSQTLAADEHVFNGWSIDRGTGWDLFEVSGETSETVFTDFAVSPIWDKANQICAPSSAARSTRIWDRHNTCLGCTRPHSLGQFVSDWAVAGDICHQPDLAHLHGFFTGPASWKMSTQLVPLFSQSSVPGFGDIVFPSPWNYLDKVEYAPSEEHPDVPYPEKENTIFWIGSTSEGISINGQWQGMVRQRLTHLINNNTQNSVSVLMRSGAGQSYEYRVMNGAVPRDRLGLQASIHINEPISHCVDCGIQASELSSGDRVDFQDHWRYRYLFDMDGAGFSGRFHSFLQSHSIPFKTALFRQWFDSRITAWMHFVPQDLRLHDVWSTLAYFAGVSVPVPDDGEHSLVLMEPHDTEGEWIAEQGHQWAHQVLRKEDMEIYFFRLLLEWGRMTDDARDRLGFKL